MVVTRKAVSEHEAGHLVVAWASGRVSKVLWAKIDTRGNGSVAYLSPERALRPTGDLWAECVIKLAGISAQLWQGNKLHAPGACDDLFGARSAAEAIARRIEDVHVAFPAKTEGVRAVARLFVREPTGAVRHVLEAAYLKARLVLRAYDPEARQVARALDRYGVLCDRDLAMLLGRRPRGDGIFVLPRGSKLWRHLRLWLGRGLLLLDHAWR